MSIPDDAMVTIPLEEYRQLKKDSRWLAALKDAGVDNWPGVDNARDTLREWGGEED